MRNVDPIRINFVGLLAFHGLFCFGFGHSQGLAPQVDGSVPPISLTV